MRTELSKTVKVERLSFLLPVKQLLKPEAVQTPRREIRSLPARVKTIPVKAKETQEQKSVYTDKNWYKKSVVKRPERF